MGVVASRISSICKRAPQHKRLVMFGLDGAGKTTILYKLLLDENVTTAPTTSYNIEEVPYKDTNFEIWDIGGAEDRRPYWRNFVNCPDGLIYVVDSTDVDRLHTAREQLHTYLAVPELDGVPVLVWANKQDLPNAVRQAGIVERMGMNEIEQGRWCVQECQVRSGQGLYEGLDWLAQASRRKRE